MNPLAWRRLGHVFSAESVLDHDWIKSGAQSPAALVLSDRVRVFFCSRGIPESDGQVVSRLFFLDLDPQDLTKVISVSPGPIAPLGGLGSFDEFGMNPLSVIEVDGEVRIYYAGWTRCTSVRFNAAIGVMVSHDSGDTFHRVGPGPVLGFGLDEPFLLGSPRVRHFDGVWYMWYVAGKRWLTSGDRSEPVYKLRMAVSNDGYKWKREGRDIIDSVLGPLECQASGEVFVHQGRYHMLFSYRGALDYKTGHQQYRMGHAVSDNLTNWTREDANTGFGPSGTGWDSESVSYPNIFRVDGFTHMFYQGNGTGATGFGLAQLDSQNGGS